MELYAAGFNAWSQLEVDTVKPCAGATLEPCDIISFTRVLSAEAIERPVAGLSSTLIKADGCILVAGFPDTSDVSDLARSYRSVRTATGKTLDSQRCVTLTEPIDDGHDDDGHDDDGHDDAHHAEGDDSPVKQLAAYDTGFVALLDDTSVWTCGDERFPNCLGGSSDQDEDRKLGSWTRVRWLDDLPTGPVVKIAAGGYILAALTEGGDLYCWGGRPGQTPLFEDLSNVPIPVDLGVDADVKDVALGERHIIVLTTDGRVMVRGCNKNGQLGLGDGVGDTDGWVEEWKSVEDIPNSGHGVVMGVAAGPRASFILCNSAGQEHRYSS